MSAARTVKLTDAELRHILDALKLMAMDGYYYGNRAQFEVRHQKITRKLEAALAFPTNSEGPSASPSSTEPAE